MKRKWKKIYDIKNGWGMETNIWCIWCYETKQNILTMSDKDLNEIYCKLHKPQLIWHDGNNSLISDQAKLQDQIKCNNIQTFKRIRIPLTKRIYPQMLSNIKDY